MDIPMIVITLILTVISTLYLGALLSERLPEIDRRFDRKPFNCRPCFIFHLTWIFSATFALMSCSWQLFVAGIAVAFIVFLIVKFIDNKKIIK